MTNTPDNKWHVGLGLATLALGMLYMAACVNPEPVRFGLTVLGALAGIWLYNPDTFTPSKSQKRWGLGKIVFQNKIYRFTHHAISHNPIIWVLVTWIIWHIITYERYDPLAIYPIVGITLNALFHIFCDMIHMLRQFFRIRL